MSKKLKLTIKIDNPNNKFEDITILKSINQNMTDGQLEGKVNRYVSITIVG